MAADQLFGDGVERIINPEFVLFRRHLGEEDGLQHQIAQLFSQTAPIAPVDRVQHFIGLFQKIRFDGVEALFAIPRASPGSA